MRFLGRRVGPAAAPGLLLLAAALGSAVPGTPVHAGICQPGLPEAGDVTAYGYVATGTKLYTLLDPATCAACPSPPGLGLTTAWIRLKFNSACSATLRVSVIGRIGAVSCPLPYETQVLCGPVEQVITGAAGESGAYPVSLPAGCCILGRAFLLIEVLAWPGGAMDLGIGTAGSSCVPCVQRWWRSILGPESWDVCDAYYGFTRNPGIWVDADCCVPTPTVPNSWGRMKSMYR